MGRNFVSQGAYGFCTLVRGVCDKQALHCEISTSGSASIPTLSESVNESGRSGRGCSRVIELILLHKQVFNSCWEADTEFCRGHPELVCTRDDTINGAAAYQDPGRFGEGMLQGLAGQYDTINGGDSYERYSLKAFEDLGGCLVSGSPHCMINATPLQTGARARAHTHTHTHTHCENTRPTPTLHACGRSHIQSVHFSIARMFWSQNCVCGCSVCVCVCVCVFV